MRHLFATALLTVLSPLTVLTVLTVLSVPALPAAAQVPAIDAFFDSMAIDVGAGRHARFVAGDNLDGYYAGFTQGTGNGEGYVTRAGTQLLDFASTVAGVAVERSGAAEQIVPWGRRLRSAEGVVEELALLSKQHALAMALRAPHPALLAIAPLLRAPGTIWQQDGAVLVAPAAGESVFVALVADQPFRLDAGLVLRTTVPVSSLTVVAAVGTSADQALARARAIAPAGAINAEKAARHAVLTRSYLATSDATYNQALNWAKASAAMFVVDEFGAGIWAGLPWFRDNWGRDTFIALPGTLLVSGQFDQARAVLANFARYQQRQRGPDYGRIANRVAASAPLIFNTVDGTPWMLREALETIAYTGDKALARQMYQLALPYFEGAIASDMDADGLLRHDSADTWMDARIANRQPWSARGPYAVEIQALWYTALQTGAALARQAGDDAKARYWSGLASKVKDRFTRRFWDAQRHLMADRLRQDGSADVKVRPNQLMLVTIPFDDFVAPTIQAHVIHNATSALLYPYGIASLSQDHPYFHPRHENPAFHHKDAAYHQGTIWGWNAGFTISALTKFGYQDHAWRLTESLGRQMLGIGADGAHATLGHMSELLDAVPQSDGSLTPSGTYAQSWSVAEFARNAYQDYLGFRPDLTAGVVRFVPAIPAAWTSLFARLPFGVDQSLTVDFRRSGHSGRVQSWRLSLRAAAPRTVTFDLLDPLQRRVRVRFTVRPGVPVQLASAPCGARSARLCVTLHHRALAGTVVQAAQTAIIGRLRFRQPPAYDPAHFPMLRSTNALHDIIVDGGYR
ncbi:amylo-alpha-1,6-glucosidase [Massilia sp. PWRC2]|uniref:amylo-alpha-1,6-glucosidase n=1 Tax=Massilia sp. PWRC2 TaxID=2804626 RepID=UPI003CEB9BB8